MTTIEERIQTIRDWITDHKKEDERRDRELKGYEEALTALEKNRKKRGTALHRASGLTPTWYRDIHPWS